MLMILFFSLLPSFVLSFTCQGNSYSAALSACPDQGEQQLSIGGNVTFFVRSIRNLPNKAMYGLNDPYVKFSVGDVTASTTVKKNTLNPVWNEAVNIGFLGSATLIKIEIWNSQSGIEFSDKRLLSSSIRVPYCSTFHANESAVNCGKPFGCSSDDSLWNMPSRQMCNETGTIKFSSDLCSSRKSLCLSVDVILIPFTMGVELQYKNYLLSTPTLTAAGSSSKAAIPWASNFGYPFLNDKSNRIDTSDQFYTLKGRSFVLIKGALMFRMSNSDRSYGAAETIKFYAGINFPAYIYVCRSDLDNGVTSDSSNDDTSLMPKWLVNGYNDRNSSIVKINLETGGSSSKNYFKCYYKYNSGTYKNKWGGVTGGAIPFYTNTISGHDSHSKTDQAFYSYNYIILAVPHVVAPREDSFTVTYDAATFLTSFGAQGLVFGWFAHLISLFVKKINFRIDRISSFLASRVLTGKDRTLIAGLFLNYGQTPNNVDYRAHLFHARNIYVFVISIPFVLILSWGISLSLISEPKTLGFFIAFVGMGWMFGWYAVRLWECSNWRLTPLTIFSIILALFSLFIFLMCSIFYDPAVIHLQYTVNITSLSLIFGTVNVMPLLLLVFQQDRSHNRQVKSLLLKLIESVFIFKDHPFNKDLSEKYLAENKVNKLLHALLGQAYSLNPLVPVFQFATALTDFSFEIKKEMDSISYFTGFTKPKSKFVSSANAVGTNGNTASKSHELNKLMKTDGSTVEESRSESEWTLSQKLYYSSLGFLIIYLIIAAARTNHPSLAFLHCWALLLFDLIHESIGHGDINWTPGFKIILLIIGRILIMGSPPSLWIINYCAAYLVYSLVLVNEMINTLLPMLSLRQAGEIAFMGNDESRENPSFDIAGSAYFCLGLLTFCFCIIILIGAFDSTNGKLPVPILTVWGDQWAIFIFGMISLLVTIIVGLISATIRSFYLEKHGLLRGWARVMFLWKTEFNTPKLLAGFTEVSIIAAGLLIYAATDAKAVLVGSLFLPVIIVCFGHAYRVWIANDYDLVVWPPKPPQADEYDGPSELETAYNMIEGMFGADDDMLNDIDGSASGPETDLDSPTKAVTLKGFKLPELKATGGTVQNDIKMPPLPLKSVLRKKRESLGIKTKLPLVNDLRGRDGAVDNDHFGDTNEVVDMDDPWAQYENINEDSTLLANKKKKSMATKKSFFEWKYVAMFILWFHNFRKTSKIWNCCCTIPYMFCKNLTAKRAKVYPNIYHANSNLKSKSQESGDVVNIGGVDPDEIDDVENDNGTNKESKVSSLPKIIMNDNNNDKIITIQPNGSVDAMEHTENDGNNEGGMVAVEDLTKISFNDAMFGGYLSNDDYIALVSWYGGMLMVMFMGVTLSLTVHPVWLGHVIWVAIWEFIITAIIFVKYFHTYVIDSTMIHLTYFIALLHFLFFVCVLAIKYNGDMNKAGAEWILDFFLLYPMVIYVLYEIYKWYDNGFKYIPLDINNDGKITLLEIVKFLSSTPFIICLAVLVVFQLYVWASYIGGVVSTLILLVSIFGYYYIRDWTANDFFLSPELKKLGNIMINITIFISFCVAVFRSINPILSISIFFFALGFKYFSKAFSKIFLMRNNDIIIYFSPFVMPVYTLDAGTNDVVDQTVLVKDIFYSIICGLMWGCCFTMFYYPMNIGIAITCGFVLMLAAVITNGSSYVPSLLSKSVAMIDPTSIVTIANTARDKYVDRRSALNFEISTWEEDNVVPFDAKSSVAEQIKQQLLEKTKTPLEKLKERLAIEIASEMIRDNRSLKYVKKVTNNNAPIIDKEEEDEYELPWYKQIIVDMKELFKLLMEQLPINKSDGIWGKHSEALFTVYDGVAEMIIAGKGPLSVFGLEGSICKFLKSCKESPRYQFLYPKWFDNYDENGNSLSRIQLSEPIDTVGILTRLPDYDTALNFVYKEELRCSIHFLLLMIAEADAKLQREKVLFQKFLRENRLRLASNGIIPPKEIFSSASFASINIPLVSVWLSTLSDDERDRFHLLKQTFSQELSEKDLLVDQADVLFEQEISDLIYDQQKRDQYMYDKLHIEVYRRKEARIQAFADSLEGYGKIKFSQRRDLWLNDLDCYVDIKEKDLYEMFKNACLNVRDEAREAVHGILQDVEGGQKDAHTGEYGREVQFVDSEFPPVELSLATGSNEILNNILGWRCAPGINDTIQLFDGGTHPDEIEEGVFRNTWLTSAISMLVAASEYGNGIINDQILKLFIGHPSLDGDITLHTEVGAYCVQLFKNGEWIPIIIDDIFPMRKKELWTSENRGMACAHNKECRGIWVSLIEKAFAKYAGSYAELTRGAVHLALQELTGCEAECISLSAASRGVNKRMIWNLLLNGRKNGYILGAGTGSADLVDKEIQDMGIVFDSAYTIYEVLQVDNQKLLKIRNPPGDHSEWKGDWSDNSKLWTRRLKKKLDFQDDSNDNTFYMTFDDFCNVFRKLYICKYYNPKKWIEVDHPGVWKKSSEAEVDQMDMMNQFMEEQDGLGASQPSEVDQVALDRRKARARLDCAGGLPSKHNPGCILENNPHYSLFINKPTDFKILCTQLNVGGKSDFNPHPSIMMILRNSHPSIPMRIQDINKEDVMYSTGEPRASKTLSLYGTLQPGLYMILIATYIAGMEGSFRVNLISNNKTEFHPIWPPMWMLRGEGELPADGLMDTNATLSNSKIKGKQAKLITSSKIKSSKSNKMDRSISDAKGMFSRGMKLLLGNGGVEDDISEEDDDDREERAAHLAKYDEEIGLH
eukprot:gene11932-15972_t